MSEKMENMSLPMHAVESSRKILVVTSCTKDKSYLSHLSDGCQILTDQLWDEQDDDRLERDFGALESYRMPAVQLYQGLQHREVMRGVALLRQTFGDGSVDVAIISAGFGVIREQQLLPPYEATFADLSTSRILSLSQRLRIPQKMNELLTKNTYDGVFFLLGENYLISLGLPFVSEPLCPCFFLASSGSQKRIPKRNRYHIVPVGKDDATAFRYNLIGLKGHLFRLFAEQIIHPHADTPTTILRRDLSPHERLEHFFTTPTPEHFLSIIHSFRRVHASSSAHPTEHIV